VRSAAEMERAVRQQLPGVTIVVAAAAVSDYRPASVAAEKLKKSDAALSLELVRTPDILNGLGAAKGGHVLVGFAAETRDLLRHAREKLQAKNLDLIVANDVSAEGSGFAAETNAATILRPDGTQADVPLGTKRALAERILDEVKAIRTGAAPLIATRA
jgi:phosphopantothenoylcysteine decarboxylase/phosphopantothenate--cysteine ligase